MGTTIGASTTNTCPTATTYTYYQPFSDHFDEFGENILTAHGANAPTITGWNCPEDDILHPAGTWSCRFEHYNSQGYTYATWSVGTPINDTTASGTCSAGSPYSVTVTVTNDYGYTNVPSNFTCPN
jgi:hypothetical protein